MKIKTLSGLLNLIIVTKNIFETNVDILLIEKQMIQIVLYPNNTIETNEQNSNQYKNKLKIHYKNIIKLFVIVGNNKNILSPVKIIRE